MKSSQTKPATKREAEFDSALIALIVRWRDAERERELAILALRQYVNEHQIASGVLRQLMLGRAHNINVPLPDVFP
jgi:hypothetical protein